MGCISPNDSDYLDFIFLDNLIRKFKIFNNCKNYFYIFFYLSKLRVFIFLVDEK